MSYLFLPSVLFSWGGVGGGGEGGEGGGRWGRGDEGGWGHVDGKEMEVRGGGSKKPGRDGMGSKSL